MDTQKNADRFTGFAQMYDRVRPAVPEYPVQLLLRYMERKPEHVVDIGCGTGLSSVVWTRYCDRVTGVEPNGEMLAVAQKKACARLSFRRAYAHATELADACADVVCCSQAFHWMEPVSTIREIGRILKPEGVFATIDCDWPPVVVWRLDSAYEALDRKTRRLEREYPEIRDTFIRYDKNEHLKNLKESGIFRYVREVVFAHAERCSAERLIGLLFSQGSVQAILKHRPALIRQDLLLFKEFVTRTFCGADREIDFSYRMRIAVK